MRPSRPRIASSLGGGFGSRSLVVKPEPSSPNPERIIPMSMSLSSHLSRILQSMVMPSTLPPIRQTAKHTITFASLKPTVTVFASIAETGV